MTRALFLVPAAVATLLAANPARACDCDHDAASHASAERAPAVRLAAADSASVKNAQVVKLTVTKDGFVPEQVTVKSGKPVKLVVTRTVERTCATEIVMKDFGVNQPLPLNKAVTVTVTPKKPGNYRFACGMDMIAGVLKAE